MESASGWSRQGTEVGQPHELASEVPSLQTVGSSFLVSARQTDLRALLSAVCQPLATATRSIIDELSRTC